MAPTTALKRLRKRIAKLPQELLDQIKELTLAYDPASIDRVIDQNYKPPFQLQFNHQLRREFLPVYYATPGVWIFNSTRPGMVFDTYGFADLFEKWLRSISSEARTHLCAASNAVPRH